MFIVTLYLIAATRVMCAQEISHDFNVRQALRDVYMKRAIISTTPTSKGKKEVDAFHPYMVNSPPLLPLSHSTLHLLLSTLFYSFHLTYHSSFPLLSPHLLLSDSPHFFSLTSPSLTYSLFLLSRTLFLTLFTLDHQKNGKASHTIHRSPDAVGAEGGEGGLPHHRRED
jgi:hypothetical protein